MAIVLEVSLTLNPVNQIAYLADFTSLVDGTQYVISATYLSPDTRFTFHGNLDITLTQPPVGVPGPNTVVPAEITTVPMAATPPPPVTYPFSTKERLDASNLNANFEFDPAAVPPHSALGGAGKFKYWMDTSTTPPSLRQCVVPRASTTYVVADWITLGTVDATNHKFHFNGAQVDFTGPITVTGTGTSTFGGSLTVSGDATVNGVLSAATGSIGSLTVSINATVAGTVSATNGNFNGALTVAPPSGLAQIFVRKPSSGQGSVLWGQTGANNRWSLQLGDTTPESAGAGSNFVVARYNDAGIFIDQPLTINRSTGIVNVGALNCTGSAIVGGATTLASAHVTGATTLDGTTNIATLAAGTVTAFSVVTSGGMSVAGVFTGSSINLTGTAAALTFSGLLRGGMGDAGELRTYNTPNVVSFRWDNTKLHYRIDNVIDSGPLLMAADGDELRLEIQQLAARVAKLEAAQ